MTKTKNLWVVKRKQGKANEKNDSVQTCPNVSAGPIVSYLVFHTYCDNNCDYYVAIITLARANLIFFYTSNVLLI